MLFVLVFSQNAERDRLHVSQRSMTYFTGASTPECKGRLNLENDGEYTVEMTYNEVTGGEGNDESARERKSLVA